MHSGYRFPPPRAAASTLAVLSTVLTLTLADTLAQHEADRAATAVAPATRIAAVVPGH
jgi:hypothetical protein